MLALVRPQCLGVGEHNEHNLGRATEFVEMIAHGDRMINAWQSMTVAMKDQQHRMTPLIAQSPSLAARLDELNLGRGLADSWLYDWATHVWGVLSNIVRRYGINSRVSMQYSWTEHKMTPVDLRSGSLL